MAIIGSMTSFLKEVQIDNGTVTDKAPRPVTRRGPRVAAYHGPKAAWRRATKQNKKTRTRQAMADASANKRQRVALEVPPRQKVEHIDDKGVVRFEQKASMKDELRDLLNALPLPQGGGHEAAAADSGADAGAGADEDSGPAAEGATADAADSSDEVFRKAIGHVHMARDEMQRLYWLLDLCERGKLKLQRTETKADIDRGQRSVDNREELQKANARMASKQQHLREASAVLRARAAELRADVSRDGTFYRELDMINQNWKLRKTAGHGARKGQSIEAAGRGQWVDCRMTLGDGSLTTGQSAAIVLSKSADGQISAEVPDALLRASWTPAAPAGTLEDAYSTDRTRRAGYRPMFPMPLCIADSFDRARPVEDGGSAAVDVPAPEPVVSVVGLAACHQLLRDTQLSLLARTLHRQLHAEATIIAAADPGAVSLSGPSTKRHPQGSHANVRYLTAAGTGHTLSILPAAGGPAGGSSGGLGLAGLVQLLAGSRPEAAADRPLASGGGGGGGLERVRLSALPAGPRAAAAAKAGGGRRGGDILARLMGVSRHRAVRAAVLDRLERLPVPAGLRWWVAWPQGGGDGGGGSALRSTVVLHCLQHEQAGSGSGIGSGSNRRRLGLPLLRVFIDSDSAVAAGAVGRRPVAAPGAQLHVELNEAAMSTMSTMSTAPAAQAAGRICRSTIELCAFDLYLQTMLHRLGAQLAR